MRRPAPKRLRSLLHRGTVRASALLVDGRLIGDRAARQRVLAAWMPGTHVYRQGDRWIVRWPAPRLLRCDVAPGAPLVEVGGALVALPEASEGLRPGTTACMVEGRLSVEPLDTAHSEDVSDWLDVDAYERAAVEPLGAPPRATPAIVDLPPVHFDARAQLAGIPPASEEQRRTIEALLKTPTGASRAGAPAPARTGGLAAWAAPLLRLLSWLRERRSAAAARSEARATKSGGTGGSGPRPESLVDRWMGRLMNTVSRAVWGSFVGRLLGRRHAEHLQHMMDLFQRGDTLEALRHAIPLGGPVAATLRSLSFGLSGPRRDLSIRPDVAAASMSLALGGDLFSLLETTYRDAFRRLEAQGRIDEAAFVLAELLRADLEAVAFLEKHGRRRLAAEMAEARDLPAGLVVRQWFLAGDRARAIEIARRRGAFADAVMRLERSGRKDEATSLRLLWANSLAEAGDYVSAVDVVWPLPIARPLALGWIDRAVETGAPSALALLPRKLEARPELFPEVRDAVVALFASDAADGIPQRSAVARALAAREPTDGARVLARAAVRSVLRDAHLYGSDWSPDRVQELIGVTGDAPLRADMPAFAAPPRSELRHRASPLVMTLDGSQAGTAAITDAAYLPGGRLVVARGESGALLLSARGKTIAHFDVPAHTLVVSDFGDRAIAVAPRGRSSRLSRLDFYTRSAETWWDAEIGAYARSYDGRHWYVATQDLFAVDVLQAGFQATWSVTDVDGIVGITRSAERCFVLALSPHLRQVWNYQLPQRTLRERRDVVFSDAPGILALSKEGRLLEHSGAVEANDVLPGRAAPPTVYWERAGGGRVERVVVEDGAERPGPIALDPDWAAVGVIGDGYVRVVVLDAAEVVPRAVIGLERATAVNLRFGAGTLTIVDDVGRLLVLDLQHGWLIRDLRL